MAINWHGALELAASLRRLKEGKVSLGQLLEIADIPIEFQDDGIKRLLDHSIKQVSFAGKRLMSGSLAFGLFDETPRLMKKAVEKGAVAVVVKEKINGIPCIVVDDPTNVYAKMCAFFRDKRPDIGTTAVIGSIGKTTVKNMVTAVYQEGFTTLTEPINENKPDIVGFTAQHLSHRVEKWVQEVAESILGSTRSMSLILKPEVAIITAMDNSHMGKLVSREAVLEETCGIAEYLSPKGIVIVDKNDFPAMELLQGKNITTISMQDNSADYYAQNVSIKKDGLYFDVIEKNSGASTPIHLNNIFAKHNVINALYAFAAGVHVGLSSSAIAKGLKNYRTTGYRNNVYTSIDGKDIIYADCYNSIARSVRSAIDTASMIPIEGDCHRIAVIGDVQELGDSALEEHLKILEIINESRFDILYLFGENLHKAASQFVFRSDLKVKLVDSHSQIVMDLAPYRSRGNLFLFKSSHSGHLEECIKMLWPKEFRKRDREEDWLKMKWKLMIMTP